MDLNEKIAARKRELAEEAARLSAEARKAEREAIARKTAFENNPELKSQVETEVTRRLHEMGFDPAPAPKTHEQLLFEGAVQDGVNKKLMKAAEVRTWGTHGVRVAMVSILGIALWAAVSWVFGVGALAGAFWMFMRAMDRHKNEIIKEGQANLADRSAEVNPEDNAASRNTCPLCSTKVSALEPRCPKCFTILN